MVNRRSLLSGILAAGTAPFVCTQAGVLMPLFTSRVYVVQMGLVTFDDLVFDGPGYSTLVAFADVLNGMKKRPDWEAVKSVEIFHPSNSHKKLIVTSKDIWVA